MGIIVPPFYFAHCTDNFPASISDVSVGTSVTAGASNAEGTTASLIAAISHDVHFLVLAFSAITVTAVDTQVIADVMVDPAGGTSWSEFISNLVIGFLPNESNGFGQCSCYYQFPVFIKAGSSIGLRAQTSDGSTNAFTATVWAFGDPSRPEQWWCGTGVETLGIDSANSKGVDITPGNSGAFGSWTTIGTSGAPYGAFQFGVNSLTSVTTNNGYNLQVGYDSTVLPGTTYFQFVVWDSEVLKRDWNRTAFWCDIPAGKTIQARGTCSGTAQVCDVAFYGVY